MLVALIKPRDSKSYQELKTLLNSTKLKHDYLESNNIIMVALKTYKENKFLLLNLLLKHVKNKKLGAINIKTTNTSVFSRALKNFVIKYLKNNILEVPVKPLYLSVDCPVCFELLTYKPPELNEDMILKIKNIGTLEYFTKLVNRITVCQNQTRTYSYSFKISLPILLSSMRSKINYNTPSVEPNIISIIDMSKGSETIIYLLNQRDNIMIKKIGVENEVILKTMSIKSNYTHNLNDLDEHYKKQVKRLILQTNIPKLTGELDYLTKCEELLQIVNNPDSYLSRFKKIKVKYYILEDDTMIIDTITLLTGSKDIISIVNTHLLKLKNEKMAIINQNYYKVFNDGKEYLQFLKENFQQVVMLRNKTLLLI